MRIRSGFQDRRRARQRHRTEAPQTPSETREIRPQTIPGFPGGLAPDRQPRHPIQRVAVRVFRLDAPGR